MSKQSQIQLVKVKKENIVKFESPIPQSNPFEVKNKYYCFLGFLFLAILLIYVGKEFQSLLYNDPRSGFHAFVIIILLALGWTSLVKSTSD